MTDEDEYPSIREALNNDSKTANAYCGIKYLMWQAGYLLFAVIGGSVTILVAILLAFMAVAEKVRGAIKTAVSRGAGKIGVDTESVTSASEKVSTAIEDGHEKSKETPGIRRLWGECPVSISQAPKWFDSTVESIEEKADSIFR